MIDQDILSFLKEESMVTFSFFPEVFGDVIFTADGTLHTIFETDGTQIYFSPVLLKDCFLHNTDLLRYAFLHTILHCVCLHPLYDGAQHNLQYHEYCDKQVLHYCSSIVPEWDVFHQIKIDEHSRWGMQSVSSDDGAKLSENSRSTISSLQQMITKLEACKLKLDEKTSSSSGSRQGSSAAAVQQSTLVKKKSIDYRSFLHRFTIPGEEPILDLDSFDYIPYYYGMIQFQNAVFLEPLEYKEVNRLDELAIAIDTSGSCSGAIVKRFLEETWAILRQKENFFSKMRLHLIQCDSFIQDHQIFHSMEEWDATVKDFKIIGHGNTDFRPVFQLLKDLIMRQEIRNLRGLLYFTDGDGIFPEVPPDFPAAFVFLNQETEKQKLPDWAIRLNLNIPYLFL